MNYSCMFCFQGDNIEWIELIYALLSVFCFQGDNIERIELIYALLSVNVSVIVVPRTSIC